MKNISIAFLVFNEEHNIKGLVDKSISELNEMPYEYNIIIVNNASTDNTGQVIDELATQHSSVKIIHNPSNLGYAMSTLIAFKQTTGDFVFIIDGDGQLSVTDIPSFIDKMDAGYEILFGWRVKRIDPPLRIVLTKFLSLFAKVILRYPHHDINCGFRATPRHIADKINIHHKVNAVGPEIYVWGKLNNCKIGEVPVKHFPRVADSSIFIPWTIPGAILKMIKYLLQLRQELFSGKK